MNDYLITMDELENEAENYRNEIKRFRNECNADGTFRIVDEGKYILYAPQKRMERKLYDKLTASLPKDTIITSALLVQLIDNHLYSKKRIFDLLHR